MSWVTKIWWFTKQETWEEKTLQAEKTAFAKTQVQERTGHVWAW